MSVFNRSIAQSKLYGTNELTCGKIEFKNWQARPFSLTAALMLGKKIFQRYAITKHLTNTNFCQIYLAKDGQITQKDMRVVKCLKQSLSPDLLPQAKHCLETEAQILKQLIHDQIPKLFDSGEDAGQFYLVRDYIEGGDLSEKELKPGRRLKEHRVIRLLQEILEIVKFVHKHKIVHCDINPSNLIRRTSDKKLVLIDFGLAKPIASQATNTVNRVQPSVLGYAPHEQTQEGYAKFNTDIYAVGMIGMQALTGVSAKDIFIDPSELKFAWPEGTKLSGKLKKIIESMVHPDPSDRCQSADEVLQELEKLTLPRRTRIKSFVERTMAGDPATVAQLVTGVVIGLVGVIFAFPGFITALQQMSNPPKPEPTVSADNFKTYKNSQYGITIQHPKDWKAQEIGGIDGEVVKFVHQPSQANVVISVKPVPGDFKSLQEYTEKSVANIKNELLDEKKQVKKYKIEEENGNALLAKREAFQVIYTGKDENNNSLKMREIWNLKDKKAYIITHEAAADKYDEFSKVVDQMVDSFEN